MKSTNQRGEGAAGQRPCILLIWQERTCLHDSRYKEESGTRHQGDQWLWILREGRDDFHLTATRRIIQQAMRLAAGRPIPKSCSNQGKIRRRPEPLFYRPALWIKGLHCVLAMDSHYYALFSHSRPALDNTNICRSGEVGD